MENVASYYNTNHEKGEELAKSQVKALTQEHEILNHITVTGLTRFTAESLWRNLFNKRVPITSVRRAVTNLMKRGTVNKLEETTTGMYGKQIHYYEVNRGTGGAQLRLY